MEKLVRRQDNAKKKNSNLKKKANELYYIHSVYKFNWNMKIETIK